MTRIAAGEKLLVVSLKRSFNFKYVNKRQLWNEREYRVWI